MTDLRIDIPERELRDLRAAFNASFDRQEEGDLASLRGNSAFREWIFRRGIVPLLLEINYEQSSDEVDLADVDVADDGTLTIVNGGEDE